MVMIGRGRVALCWLLSLLSLTVAACGGESSQTQPVTTRTDSGTSTAPPAKEVGARKMALVRFVHAVPGLAAVDVFANDAKAFAASAYKGVSPYREVPSEDQIYRVRLAGQDAAEPVAEEREGFSAGEHYTIIAVPVNASAIFSTGEGQNVELRFVSDALVAPAAGRAKVRVINTSPDLEEVDVYAAGRSDALIKGAKFASASQYAEVEPVGGGVEVRRAGENITTLNVPNVRFEAGKIYTLIVVGGTKGAARLEPVVIEDQIGNASRSS